MKITIYSIDDAETGVPFYIGVTQNLRTRKTSHLSSLRIGSTLPVYRHIRERGISIQFSVIDEIEIINKNQFHYWENFWIEQFLVWGFKLLNKDRVRPKMCKIDVFAQQEQWVESISGGVPYRGQFSPSQFTKTIKLIE